MIQFNDFKREFIALDKELTESIRSVLSSGWFILGQESEKFEEEFASYIGSKHGIGVNSGSDALYLAIRALGIGPGDEVITVSHTMISTVDAISRNGATPVFVDINADTYNIECSKLESMISAKTKAILPVHIYGNPANMEEIMRISKKNNLLVIEDACQAHGAEYRNVKVGGVGTVGCFSFYPTKNLGAYGDAGMIVTNDGQLAEKLKKSRNYGQSKKYYYDFVGVNSRLDEVQGAILRKKLPYLDKWNERRRELAKIYNDILQNSGVILPREEDNARHVYHLYVVKSKKREKLQECLLKQGIQTLVHYPVPVHLQKAYGTNDKLPNTEAASKEILSLPLNPWLSEEEIKFVANSVQVFTKNINP